MEDTDVVISTPEHVRVHNFPFVCELIHWEGPITRNSFVLELLLCINTDLLSPLPSMGQVRERGTKNFVLQTHISLAFVRWVTVQSNNKSRLDGGSVSQ